MIVKNESEVIERCLNSVKPLIDYWVIVDTGSSDGTQGIIKKCLKDIPGELHERPWVDFAHNRNEALAGAKNKADFVLFIDADEIWQYSDQFTLPNLDKDFYFITVRQLGAGDVKRIGLASNHLNWKWQGILHENLESPEAKTCETLKGVTDICNAAIGARSKDPQKFLKDARILEDGMKNDPKNSRNAYYLAQSYLNAKEYELALKSFEKRLAMESEDVQETYLATYYSGIIQDILNRPEDALQSYFKAYKLRPMRAEPLLRAATLYRKQGNILLGYLLTKYALSFPYPSEDMSIEYMTYDYVLLVEFVNCALLSGKIDEGLQACNKLLANPNLPADIRASILKNQQLAMKQINP